MHGGDGFHPGWADATRLRCVIVMPAGWGSDRWLDQRDARSYEELGGERSRLPEQSDARPGASPARLTLPTASPRDCGSRQVKPACWHDQRGHRCGQVILLYQEFPAASDTSSGASGYPRRCGWIPKRNDSPEPGRTASTRPIKRLSEKREFGVDALTSATARPQLPVVGSVTPTRPERLQSQPGPGPRAGIQYPVY
jgi:hypothetical protein